MRLNIPNQQNLNYSAHTHTKHIQNTHYNQSGKKTSILFETVNSEHEITTKKHLKKTEGKNQSEKQQQKTPSNQLLKVHINQTTRVYTTINQKKYTYNLNI